MSQRRMETIEMLRRLLETTEKETTLPAPELLIRADRER